MIHSLGSPQPQDPRIPAGGAETAKSRDAKAGKESVAGAAPAPKNDQVELSREARDLQAVQKHLSDADAARAKKVEELRRAVTEGRYLPDAHALARALLE